MTTPLPPAGDRRMQLGVANTVLAIIEHDEAAGEDVRYAASQAHDWLSYLLHLVAVKPSVAGG